MLPLDKEYLYSWLFSIKDFCLMSKVCLFRDKLTQSLINTEWCLSGRNHIDMLMIIAHVGKINDFIKIWRRVEECNGEVS